MHSENYEDVLDILRLRNQGKTYAEISVEVGVPTSTASRVVSRKETKLERSEQIES